MFNFSSDMLVDGIGDAESLAVLEKQMSAVASIATAAAVNSPVVVETPANVAPSASAVQQVVENTIQAVAPVVAPNIPANVLSDFGKFITKEVVKSPEVKASDTRTALPLEVFTEIAQNAIDTATNDKKFVNTVSENIGTVTAPYYDINKGMMVNPDGTPYVAPKAAPVPSAAPATPEDVGLAPRVAAPTPKPAPGSEAAAAGLVFGAGAGTQAETPEVAPTVPYYDINKGIMVEPEVATETKPTQFAPSVTPTGAYYDINKGMMVGPDGVAPVVPGPATPKGAVYDIDKGIMVEPETVEEEPLPPVGEGEEPVTPPVGEGKEPPAPTPGQTYTAPDGKIFTDINEYNAYLQQLKLDEKKRLGQSAYDLLFEQFNQFGLGALVAPLQSLITEGLSAAEFTLRLRDTDAYKKRFGANQQRIAKGLRALSEAEYIGLEDQYQNIMRQYGLPESYYTRGDMGRQEGFEKFIAGDVSPSELEDRVATAQNRIIYANPEVSIALKNFYPDISNGDLLAYALDPDKALAQIKRRISAAEIGASAVQLGLATNVTDAEYLARYGVTKEQAQQGYRSVAEVLPRASFLGDVYGKQGMGPYTQQTAEREVFNVPGAAEAAAQRRKLTELEQAQFSGRAGTTGGALARERAGGF